MVYKNIVDVRVDELLPVCRDCHKLIHQAIKDGYISQNPKKLEEIKEKTVHILMDQDYIDLRKWLDGKHPLSADYIKIIREDNREFLIKRIRGITKKNVWYKDLESLRVTGRQLKKIRGLIETHLHREKRGLNSKKVVGRFKSRIIPKKRT